MMDREAYCLCAPRLETAVFVLCISGCTSTTYTGMSEQKLHEKIASGEKLQVTHPVGQAAVVTGFGLAYIALLALPAAVIAAFAL